MVQPLQLHPVLCLGRLALALGHLLQPDWLQQVAEGKREPPKA